MPDATPSLICYLTWELRVTFRFTGLVCSSYETEQVVHCKLILVERKSDGKKFHEHIVQSGFVSFPHMMDLASNICAHRNKPTNLHHTETSIRSFAHRQYFILIDTNITVIRVKLYSNFLNKILSSNIVNLKYVIETKGN